MCSAQANSIWVRVAKAGPQSASFCKYGFTGTQPRPFISILSRAALVLESSECDGDLTAPKVKLCALGTSQLGNS